MLNLPDNLSITPAPNPVDRVTPVLSVDKIGTPLQELNARATQLVKGQEYIAQVVSKLDDKAYLIKVDNTVLKMELGNAAQAGQTLVLRYVQDRPVPTFLLAPTPNKSTDGSLQLSPAANLIGQYLKQAEKAGVSNRHEATATVTLSPKNPQIVAQDLRQTISRSGLFYESHLNEMVQGTRTVAAVMQEPQNQNVSQIAHLMTQQLAMLENQRLSWHGEVWPGQKMDWDVYLHDRQQSEKNEQEATDLNTIKDRPITSELTLNFPNLGKVTAKLNLVDGHMRISILAEQADVLKAQTENLSHAIINSGLQLDALTVSQYD